MSLRFCFSVGPRRVGVLRGLPHPRTGGRYHWAWLGDLGIYRLQGTVRYPAAHGLTVNGVGEPGAGEPHARFDGRELETERDLTTATTKNDPAGNRSVTSGFASYRQADVTPPAPDPNRILGSHARSPLPRRCFPYKGGVSGVGLVAISRGLTVLDGWSID